MTKTEAFRSSVERWPERFWNFGAPKKFIPLALGSILLIFHLRYLYYQTVLSDVRGLLQAGVGNFNAVYLLTQIDALLLIAAGMFPFALAALWMRSPIRPFRALRFFENRPFSIFFLTLILALLALLLLPSMILYGPVQVLSQQGALCFPKPGIIFKLFLFSMFIAAYFADVGIVGHKARWWLIPFTVYPFPFPMLCFSALGAWLPSRYWAFAKPPLIAATFLAAILNIGTDQPIYDFQNFYTLGTVPRNVLRAEPTAQHAGTECMESYQIKQLPKRPEFVIRCQGVLMSGRADGTSWDLKKSGVGLPGAWDEGSFDFDRNEMYVYDLRGKDLYTVGLSEFSLISVHHFSVNELPAFPDESPRQEYIPDRRLLFVSQKFGHLAAIDLKNNKVLFYRKLPRRGDEEEIWRLLHYPKNNELLVLSAIRLTAYDIDTLKPMRFMEPEDFAFDMIFDEPRNRLIMSMPRRMALGVYDPETFELLMNLPAPAGVRSLAIDKERDLLFLGSSTGVVEVRRLADFSIVNRVRLAPWIRGLEPTPQWGQLLVTSGRVNPVAWIYPDAQKVFDPGDEIVQIIESVARRFIAPRMNTKIRPGDLLDKH